MNGDRAVGEWKQAKGKVKQNWAKLTDNDLTYVNGQRDRLLWRIQERYGTAEDWAQKQVKDCEGVF